MNLDELYENYENSTMDKKQLTNKVMECIYLEPKRYGMGKLTPDQKSDFMVYLLQKIETQIARYSKNIALFSTYIITFIYNLRKTWIREFFHEEAHKQSVHYYVESENESNSYILAEPDYAYNKDLPTENEIQEKLSNRDKYTILVLALKSFYYLEDNHIEQIAKITEISKDTIQELIHTLSNLCEKKIDLDSKRREKLNSSYIKKNRFSLELMNVDHNSSLAYHLKKAQVFHTRQWKKNLKHYNESPALKPSNANIAATLNIKEAKVYQLLHESRKRHMRGIPIIRGKTSHTKDKYYYMHQIT